MPCLMIRGMVVAHGPTVGDTKRNYLFNDKVRTSHFSIAGEVVFRNQTVTASAGWKRLIGGLCGVLFG